MKSILKIFICVCLILSMGVLLTACGDEETTTTTAPTPKEYTAKETEEILNEYFGALSEALATDEDSSLASFIDDFSVDNIVNNGVEGLGFDMMYVKDGLTYTVSNGEVYIEKEKDGFVASISSDSQSVSQIDDGGSTIIDPSQISFKATNIKPKTGKMNQFGLKGDTVAALMNMIEGVDTYDSSISQSVKAEIDMTLYEKEGVISITITTSADGEGSITVKFITDYENGKGKINLICESDLIKHNVTLTAGDANAIKIEYIGEATVGSDKLEVKILMESKGDDYVIPDGTPNKSCDAEVYEMSIKKNSDTLVTVKLNAGKIGDKIKGYIDAFMGDGAPGMGGIGLLNSSNEMDIAGSFDITLNGEEIAALSAQVEMSYSLISGNVSVSYNANNMKIVGAIPLTVSISDNGKTSNISLKTVSYQSGQGGYALEITDGENTLTADVAIPAIKTFQLTEREQLYLERADLYLNHAKNVENELSDLFNGAQSYALNCIENRDFIEPYVLSKNNGGSRYYLTHFYEYDGMVYYEIFLILDRETASYLYRENKGTLTDYYVESHVMTEVEIEIMTASSLDREAWEGTELSYPALFKDTYIIEFYSEKGQIYVYFNSSTNSQYTASKIRLDEDSFEYAVHTVDLSGEANIFEIHNFEASHSSECYIIYTCVDCGTQYRSKDYDHHENSITVRELSGTDAKAEYISCDRCGGAYLCFTDSQGNKINFGMAPLSESEAEGYGIEGDISKMVVFDEYARYNGEDGEFDRVLNIPSITEKTGYTLVGMNSMSYFGDVISADVILPEGIIYAEHQSFAFDVTSLTLPSTLRSFGGGAFRNDPTLTELIIPENVVYFGSNSFPYLEKLTVNAKNMEYLYIPKMKTYDIDFNCESIDVLYYRPEIDLETIIIPEGTKLFYGIRGNRYVKKVVVPYGIESIPGDSFMYCLYLTEAVLPDNLTRMGTDLFEGCEALTTVKVILEDGTIIGNDNEVLIPRSATAVGGFNGCKSITKVILPHGITYISIEAFLDCTELSYIRMPSDLETIGFDAFRNCTKLGQECFNFGNKLKSVGNYAFYGTGIKELTIYAEAGVSNFSYLSLAGANIDHLIIKGQLNDLSKLYFETELINVKEITIENAVRFGGTYGSTGTETINIKYTEKTDYQYAVYTIPENVITVNFIGTEEQFKNLGFVVDGQFTEINYNVVFE